MDVKKQHKKGQSAIEYLMTYGWAMLVLVLIVGLLFSTGIFSPNYLISEECNLGPKLPCSHFLYNDGKNLRLLVNVTNGFEYKIKIKSVSVSFDKGNMSVKISNDNPLSGDSAQIDAMLAGYNAAKDSTKKFTVSIDYYSCAAEVNPTCYDTGTATHKISGRISAKAN